MSGIDVNCPKPNGIYWVKLFLRWSVAQWQNDHWRTVSTGTLYDDDRVRDGLIVDFYGPLPSVEELQQQEQTA